MPVILKLPQTDTNRQPSISSPIADRVDTLAPIPTKQLALGLINNMLDGAPEATERQFISLLESASDGFSIELTLYALPGVPRKDSTADHVERNYVSAESLWDTELDGLIVTGREPLSRDLRDEPYWKNFVRVLEWARDNTSSTVWSCLAAHAAVLHMSGVERQRSEKKHCGVFDCTRVSDHLMTAGIPSHFRLPHSRWNGLSEARLTDCGYQILTRANEAGVDCFVKQEHSLFVFFQGHPEYEAGTLLYEYRRDVGRYLRGESGAYPTLPRGYFSDSAARKLSEIQHHASQRSQAETLLSLEEVLSSASRMNGWCGTATTLYRNWLEEVYRQKTSHEKNATATLAASMSTYSI
jgi:homoserine O-succinyltransferase/O-acetyltransferase